MARRTKSTEAPATAEVESTEENTVSTDTETVTEAAATEAPATEAPATEAEVADLSDFTAAHAAAIEARDESTGDVPEAEIDKVVQAYRLVKGAKGKSEARKLVDEAMKKAMDDADIQRARANLQLTDKLVAGPVSSGGTRATREPVDPTADFVERVAGLRLATRLSDNVVPEGVAEDWSAQADAKVDELAARGIDYLTWLQSDAEDKGDEPEVDAVVKAAVKLAQGKAAKVGARKRSTGTSQPFDGPRRDVAKHISEAFAAVESGTFLSIAEIRKHQSEEYGANDSPSPGAISARLFPKSGNVTVEGIKPDTQNGKKGAVKL